MANLLLLQSRIPSIIAETGYSIAKMPQTVSVYDGRHLTTFLKANGSNYDDTAIKSFLLDNKIGSPFDIEQGINVRIKKK